MKKGTLHLLGRKKQSLFDTNNPVKIQTMGEYTNLLHFHRWTVIDMLGLNPQLLI